MLMLAPPAPPAPRDIGAIVLVDSAAPAYGDFTEFVQLYLNHFDVPYSVWDVARRTAGPEIGRASLLIVGHGGVNLGAGVEIRRAVENGAGLVSFDGAFPLRSRPARTEAQFIAIGAGRHYITARKAPGERIPFRGQFALTDWRPLPEGFETLAATGDMPLVVAGRIGKGRVVAFSSYAWLDPEHLGFFAGLDDMVWRSLAWAARKPFVMQGMPPLVSMRVDDCKGGTNRDWAYLDAIHAIGIVPHCAFMLDEITDACARRMAELVKAGRLQVSVHARRSSLERDAFFWWDHARGRPFDDPTMERNYRDAARFFEKYGLAHAKSINIHYEEMGRNAQPYLARLGVEFVVSWTSFGLPAYRQDMFRPGPYLFFRPAAHWAVAPSSASAGHLVYNPRAVMDWLDAEHRFFDSYVDPIDIKYDWLRKCELPPYSGTLEDAGMIADGAAMLKRELDSMFPAYFFTHEVNIDRYDTARLTRLARGVWNELAAYHPEPVSYDDLNRYARAQFTSKMERAAFDPARNRITVRLSGSSDIPTRFWVFTDQGERMETAPPFTGSVEVSIIERQ